jgi:hypothetical protein
MWTIFAQNYTTQTEYLACYGSLSISIFKKKKKKTSYIIWTSYHIYPNIRRQFPFSELILKEKQFFPISTELYCLISHASLTASNRICPLPPGKHCWVWLCSAQCSHPVHFYLVTMLLHKYTWNKGNPVHTKDNNAIHTKNGDSFVLLVM